MSRVVDGVEPPSTVAMPSTDAGGVRPRLPAWTAMDRGIGAVLLASAVANLVYLIALVVPGDPAATLVDVWLSDIAEGLPVLVFWLVAKRSGFRRPEILLAAGAMTFNLAGDVYYGLAMDSDGYLPSPSPADIGYLLYYPLLAAAFIVTVLRRSRRLTWAVLIDVGLASLGSASVLAVLLGPMLTDAMSGANPVDDAIAAMYPLFDLVLVAIVVGVAASSVLRVGPRAPLLVAGLLLFTGADVLYALQDHAGAYVAGTPLDAVWTIAVLCTAVWVTGADRFDRVEDEAPRSRRMLPVAASAVIAGLAVLLVATQVRLPLLALVLAGATVALSAIPVLLRQADLARSLAAREQVVERLLAVDKAKNDMIATVNHEMRTPLTAVSGYLELVLDDEGGPIPGPARDMLRVAQDGATRLATLVADMMASTRLEAAGEPALVPLSIDELLDRVITRLRPAAEARNVRIELDGPEPLTIDGERDQLERVFSNVIENAVKFSPTSGSVRVVLHRAGSRRKPVALVSVVDRGMGIPRNELASLFDRFFRGSNARSAVVPGSGLGLSIARGIVEAHGGVISVESDEGVGTTMRIALPLSHG